MREAKAVVEEEDDEGAAILAASAIGLIVPEPSGTNAKKTKNMMSAAAVTTRAFAAKPCRTALTAAWPCA